MEYSIDDLTPKALADIIANEYGGGMVQALILGAEVVTPEGERRNLFIWDRESSITIQLGLVALLSRGIDLRAESAFCDLMPDLDDEEGGE